MAAADYRLCDCCDGKVFYDSNLNYEFGEILPSGHMKVDYLGDWAVICEDCAKTHKTLVLTNEQAAALATPPVASGALTDDALYNFWLYRDCMDAIRAGDIRAQFISAARAAIAASTAAAAPNAALVEALKACKDCLWMMDMESSDSYQGAVAALAQAGEVAK